MFKVRFAASHGGPECQRHDGFGLREGDAPSAPTSQELHHPLPLQTRAIKKGELLENKLKSACLTCGSLQL